MFKCEYLYVECKIILEYKTKGIEIELFGNEMSIL